MKVRNVLLLSLAAIYCSDIKSMDSDLSKKRNNSSFQTGRVAKKSKIPHGQQQTDSINRKRTHSIMECSDLKDTESPAYEYPGSHGTLEYLQWQLCCLKLENETIAIQYYKNHGHMPVYNDVGKFRDPQEELEQLILENKKFEEESIN